MADHTFFLLGEDTFGWSTLRGMLPELHGWRLSGTASVNDVEVDPPSAVPDVVVATTATEDAALAPLLSALRQEQWPEWPALVIAPHYTIDALLAFHDAGVSGYFLWRRLKAGELLGCLNVLESGKGKIHVYHPGAGNLLMGHRPDRPLP